MHNRFTHENFECGGVEPQWPGNPPCPPPPGGCFPPYRPKHLPGINYSDEEINNLLSQIGNKAEKEDVARLDFLKYIGHVVDASFLTEQEESVWATVGSLTSAKPYIYYTESFIPIGYREGWNDVSSVMGTYDLTGLNTLEYNVSLHHTLNGRNEFTFAEAVDLVPGQYRFEGVRMTFINLCTHQAETWYYKGDSWTDICDWTKIDFEAGGGQITAEELWKEKFESGAYLVADRAIADELGNRITDTYVMRNAVVNHIKRIYNEMFVANPPLIVNGYITPEMLSESVLQMLAEAGVTITNLPDGEDLATVHGVLKFANKKFVPNAYSGMGRQYLRKNMVGGLNVLTQSMMKWVSTIYVIQYDYDLQGETIEIPENSILLFEGGHIENGKVVLNNTSVCPQGCVITDYIDAEIEGSYAVGQSLFNSESQVPQWWNGTMWVCYTDILPYIPVADEEDLTLKNIAGENLEKKAVLSIKDRDNTNGLGYCILRKESELSSQISKENTIYEIRYDFDLNDSELNIPAGCVLNFNGGTLKNGTLIFNDTSIRAEGKVFDGIQWSGKVLGAMNVVWFGAKGDGVTDDTYAFKQALRTNEVYDYAYNSPNPGIKVFVPKGTYVIRDTLYVRKGCILQGESCGNTFIHSKMAYDTYTIKLGEYNDVIDRGGLQPVVDNLFIISETGCRGIYCNVQGFKISNCWFTCTIAIALGKNALDGVVTNCVNDAGHRFILISGKGEDTLKYNGPHSIIVSNCINYAGYSSIYLNGAYGVIFSNCAFYYSRKYTIELAGLSGNITFTGCDFRTSLDSEYYEDDTTHIKSNGGGLIDSIISNCTFSNSRSYDINLTEGQNIIISNNLFKDGNNRSIRVTNTSNIKIDDNLFTNYTGIPVLVQAPTFIDNNTFINCKNVASETPYENACIKVEQSASSGCRVTNNYCDNGNYVASFTTTSLNNVSNGNYSKGASHDIYVFDGSGGTFENERVYSSSVLAKIHKGSYAGRPALNETDAGFLFYDPALTPERMILWNGSAWVNLDGTEITEQ